MWSDSFKLSCTEKTQRLRSLNTSYQTFRWEAHHGFVDNKSSFAVRRLTFFRIALLIPVLLLMTWSGANAQLAGKGQINGTVTDTSGAAIPGAQVVVKSKQTSLSTNDDHYLFW